MSNIDKSFLRDLHGVAETKIDATKSENLNNKVLSEYETRKRLLTHARLVGCEREMMILFHKADNLLKKCTNEQERKDIGKLFSVDVFHLLGGGGQLFIDGQLVCDERSEQEKSLIVLK